MYITNPQQSRIISGVILAVFAIAIKPGVVAGKEGNTLLSNHGCGTILPWNPSIASARIWRNAASVAAAQN
jgi:hypothetical protein|tara:strand:+ start:876 stop:1088 length:213 start_codon:yes stop_codon:yes gene_type:complete